MLSVFPQILFLSPFSALFIRLAVSLVLAYSAKKHFDAGVTVARSFAIVEALVALALFVGAWTQPAALLGIIVLGVSLWRAEELSVSRASAYLALVMCLSLVLTGPGPFAFDMPL